MDNIFSQKEWGIVLELLGAHNVMPYKDGLSKLEHAYGQ